MYFIVVPFPKWSSLLLCNCCLYCRTEKCFPIIASSSSDQLGMPVKYEISTIILCANSQFTKRTQFYKLLMSWEDEMHHWILVSSFSLLLFCNRTYNSELYRISLWDLWALLVDYKCSFLDDVLVMASFKVRYIILVAVVAC